MFAACTPVTTGHNAPLADEQSVDFLRSDRSDLSNHCAPYIWDYCVDFEKGTKNEDPDAMRKHLDLSFRW